tara:strand:- start:737 stop:991 length:255 start_codon:yes stop_codon:yes gene_type:complete
MSDYKRVTFEWVESKAIDIPVVIKTKPPKTGPPKKLIQLTAKFDSDCYYSYLTGCGDIKAGEYIHWEGANMAWHLKCMQEDYYA